MGVGYHLSARVRILIALIMLLTFNPIVGNCQPRIIVRSLTSYQQSAKDLKIRRMIIKYATEYKVKPSAALAVAHIEGRGLDKYGNILQEFRIGKHGRFWLPMGIYDPKGTKMAFILERNIELGVKALARYGPVRNLMDLKRTLRKYNTEFNSAYWYQIVKAERKYRKVLE